MSSDNGITIRAVDDKLYGGEQTQNLQAGTHHAQEVEHILLGDLHCFLDLNYCVSVLRPSDKCC
jgi:hypothetical protein